MALSKTGCSSSITKSDLDTAYKQGFVEGHNATNEIMSSKVNELKKRVNEISLSKLSHTIFNGNYVLREDIMQAIDDIFNSN